jgi:Rho family protein
MSTSNSPSGTQLARRNSTDYDPFPTVCIHDSLAPYPRAFIKLIPPLDDTDLIMLCYSVDSKDSLENVESKWVGEIADNCPGTKLVLVALKCDLREQGDEDESAAADPSAAAEPREKKPMINYDQGLEVARRIGAMRYLECSAMKNRGVNEAFTEAARVALSVKKDREESKCTIM